MSVAKVQPAESKVRKEFEELTDRLWLETGAKRAWERGEFVGLFRKGEQEPSAEQKAYPMLIISSKYRAKDPIVEKRFRMLESFSSGEWWHALEGLLALESALKKEEISLYSSVIVDQARKNTGNPVTKDGNGWLALQYSQGRLREQIDEQTLASIVQEGFKELMKVFLTNPGRSSGLWDRYEAIMQYNQYLDFSKMGDVLKEPILTSGDGWPDNAYRAVFKRERAKLDTRTAAWFAHPLVDQIVSSMLYYEGGVYTEQAIEETRRELKPYADYMKEPLIQSLLKRRLKNAVEFLEDDAYKAAPYIHFLSDYIQLPAEEIKNLVNSSIQDRYNIHRNVVDVAFPKEMLNQSILSKIEKEIVEDLEGERKRGDIGSFIRFAQESIKTGYLNADTGSGMIKASLQEYLERKPRPSGGYVYSLLNALSPDSVERELYIRVVKSGISDFRVRKRPELAEDWEERLEKFERGENLTEKREPVNMPSRNPHPSPNMLGHTKRKDPRETWAEEQELQEKGLGTSLDDFSERKRS